MSSQNIINSDQNILSTVLAELGIKTFLQISLFMFFLICSNSALSKTSIEDLKSKADHGDGNAAYSLSLKYYLGTEVPEDSVLAMKYLKQAAESGYPAAMLSYGKQLNRKSEALNYIKKASDMGHIPSTRYLGEIYRTPNNGYTNVDYQKSFSLLKDAAKNSGEDSLEASFRLYLMYKNGDGVEKSSQEAEQWLKKSVEKSERLSSFSDYKYDGDLTEDPFFYMNPKFISIRVAAENGDAEAQLRLGEMYSYGRKAFNSGDIGKIIFLQDVEAALHWYEKATLNGQAKGYLK